MATQQLSINNVITISVTQTQLGLGLFNTSNLALFTTETPDPSFVSKLYMTASEVATDFGSSSTTAKMAQAVFSQTPNILLPGGYLAIIPLTVSETLEDAITRTKNIVSYFGVMTTAIESEVDILAAAAVLQAENMIGFFVQIDPTSVDPGGSLDLLRTGGFSHSRGLLYYGLTADALIFQASFAGRALSTQFSGSNTVQNMHLKTLAGVQPDPGITQTILNAAVLAGVDTYPSIAGSPSVFESGTNGWFDDVYNLIAFGANLSIKAFNYLKASTTKVPQTQTGMNGFIGSLLNVCQQFVTNGYLAPGVWNSPDTFGDQARFLSNIQNFGFYIYSIPISLQSQEDRVARKLPLASVAGKTAGAANSASILVIINA